MKRPLYSELETWYVSTEHNPHTFRVTIRLKDLIDGEILTWAVKETMSRYPYFCVQFCEEEENICFEDNDAPVPVFATDNQITLGGEDAHRHLLAFCYAGNRIHVNCWHGLTDGGGLAPLLMTLLYLYCSKYYQQKLSSPYLRLPGDPISPKEWEDPLMKPFSAEYEFPTKKWKGPAFQVGRGPEAFPEAAGTVTSFRIPEEDFMQFNLSFDGSPGTIISLLLARTIDSLHPEADKPVVVSLCVNQRKALKAPFAHQSLVGDCRLVYDERLKKLSFTTQATCFRGMVALHSDQDAILEEVQEYQSLLQELGDMPGEEERRERCTQRMEERSESITATVSYVGKSSMGPVEQYIEEINCVPSTALPASHTPIVIEISSISSYFFVNFIQYLSDMDYTQAFFQQLSDHQIEFEVLEQEEARYPRLKK